MKPWEISRWPIGGRYSAVSPPAPIMSFTVCNDCGSLVFDNDQHDEFHNDLKSATKQ